MLKQLSIFLLLFITTALYAQPKKGPNKERIKALKVSFINEHLALTDLEKEKFWPIFEQYKKDKKAIHKDRPKRKNLEQMTDKELEQLLEKRFLIKEQVIVLDRKFQQDLKEVLPLIKIVKFQRVDKKFRKKIMAKARKKHKGERHQRFKE